MDKIKACGTRVTDLETIQRLLYQYTMRGRMDISLDQRLELLSTLFQDQVSFLKPSQLDIAKRPYDEDDL